MYAGKPKHPPFISVYLLRKLAGWHETDSNVTFTSHGFLLTLGPARRHLGTYSGL